MPRATRKAVAESPSRSSPRATTKASTKAAGSPSPVKGRGRRGKAEEEAETETAPRGRSTSRGKGKAAQTPSPSPSSGRGGSRSRGRSSSSTPAPIEKTTPQSGGRRGRGKAKKEEEPEAEEEENEEEEEEEEEEVKATPTSGRRGRGKAKVEKVEEVKAKTPTSGRRGRGKAQAEEKEEEEEEQEEEVKKTPTSGRRGRGKAKEEVKTPTSGRRGRGRPKKEEEEEEEEEEEKEEAEEEKEEEEESAPKRGRGRGRGRGKSPASAEKKTTPPARSARGSRRSTAPAEEEEEAEEEKDEEEKEEETTSPRGRGRGRGRGRSPAAAAAKPAASTSRSRRGRGAGEPEEMEKDAVEDAEEGGKDEDASKSADVEMESKTDKSKEEAKAEKPEPDKDEEMPALEDERSEEKKESPEKKATPVKTPEKKETTPVKTPEKKESTPVKTPEKKESTPVKTPEKKESTPVKTPEKKETPVKEKPPAETAPVPMEEEETPANEEPKNGVADTTASPAKSGVKRKLGEVVEEEETLDAKKARLNGSEPASVEMAEDSAAKEETGDGDVAKDFVMVSKEEVPAPDSAEVAAALPPPHHPPPAVDVTKAAASEAMETVKILPPPLFSQPMLIPLTEAEMTKAYANQLQGKKNESDEVSSVIVEVGSVAGSDIYASLASRGLDTSELQSASNSIDGDFAADISLNELGPEASFSSPMPPMAANPIAGLSNPVIPVAELAADTPSPVVTNTPFSTIQQPLSGEGCSSSSAQPAQNTSSLFPTKGASNVSPALGSPDPVFLATYTSPNIFTRAYVPNPAFPAVVRADAFSIVSYNILAECHRVNSDYSYTPAEFLSLNYRHMLLVRELQALKGDIVCLQEVAPAYFASMLLPVMRSMGYDGLMKSRTKGVDEGEATFYRTERFVLEASKEVSLAEAAHKEVEVGGLTPEVGSAVRKYLDRPDVVLITKLRCKVSGKALTVGNIHVVYDGLKSPDVQCIQAACAIKEVVSVAGGDGAHIICGDFNSEWNSPIYQLVLDGYLSDSSIHALQAVQRLELQDGAKSLVNHLWRAFQHTSSNLRSTYAAVTKSEPEVTTFTGSMKKAVDYIFYSAGSLQPMGVLKTIDRAVIDGTNGLPTKDFPSDHLSLKTVMCFNK